MQLVTIKFIMHNLLISEANHLHITFTLFYMNSTKNYLNSIIV